MMLAMQFTVLEKELVIERGTGVIGQGHTRALSARMVGITSKVVSGPQSGLPLPRPLNQPAWLQ